MWPNKWLQFKNPGENEINAEQHAMYCTKCHKEKTAKHNFGKQIVTKPATETEEGEWKQTCDDCKYEKTGKIPMTLPTVAPPEHEHELKYIEGTPATCNMKGTANHWHCECGMNFLDEAATILLSTLDTPYDTTNHVGPYTYIDNEDGATHTKKCMANGCVKPVVMVELHCDWTEWHPVTGMPNWLQRECGKCGAVEKQMIGCSHMWTEIKREPTCLDEGYQADKCIKCGLIVREQVLPALGHDWGEWEVVTPATTEAEGLEKRVCKRDASHVETRPIAKLEPTPAPTEEPTVEPTVEPTAEPTMAPTAEPTAEPTAQPTVEPTKKPDKTDIPKTGDNSHFGYAYLMIAVAAAGLVVLAATRRKEGSK